MTDKVNIEETNTVWSQSLQTDALLWMDVTLSTSYNKCHECTSGCESTSVTDKVNMEETNTVWSQLLPKGRGMHCYGGRHVEHLL